VFVSDLVRINLSLAKQLDRMMMLVLKSDNLDSPSLHVQVHKTALFVLATRNMYLFISGAVHIPLGWGANLVSGLL